MPTCRPGAAGLLLFCLAVPNLAATPTFAYPEMADPTIRSATPPPGQSLADQRGDLMLFQAETAIRAGDFPEAVRLLQEVLAAEPGRADALELLATAYNLWDESGEAPAAADSLRQASLDLYRRLLESDPSHPGAIEGIRRLTGHTDRPNPGRQSLPATLGPPAGADPRSWWQEAVRLDPGSVEAWRGLAQSQSAAGDTLAAETSLRIAFELAPWDEDARDSLWHLDEALNTAHPSAVRMVTLGRIAQLDGRHSDALHRLTEAMQFDSTRADVRKYYGIALYESGQEPRALDYLQPLAELAPGDLDIRFYMGSVLFRLGHLEEAFEQLAPATDEGLHQAEASRMAGYALMRTTAHHDVAVALLERARDLGSTDGSLFCDLGEEYVRLRRWTDAERSFESCETHAPGHPAAALGLGLVADSRGQPARAIPYLEAFLAKHDSTSAVLMKLGLCYLKTGHPDSAFTRLRASLEADTAFARLIPDTVSAREVFEVTSLILSAGREFDDAIALGEYMIKAWPEEPGYPNNLAMAYADGNRGLDRALILAEDANRRSPDNAGYLDTLGWVQVRLKRWSAAEQTLNRALALAGDAPARNLAEMYFHRGLLYAGMQKNDAALADLTKAAQDSENPWIRHLSERLIEELKGE